MIFYFTEDVWSTRNAYTELRIYLTRTVYNKRLFLLHNVVSDSMYITRIQSLYQQIVNTSSMPLENSMALRGEPCALGMYNNTT